MSLLCGQCEMESRTGTGSHGQPGERCRCICHPKECDNCQGLGYFVPFDLEGEPLKPFDCAACNGTGHKRREREVPMPGYFTYFGPGPRQG